MKILIEFSPDELIRGTETGTLQALFEATKTAEKQIEKAAQAINKPILSESNPSIAPDPGKAENANTTEEIPTVVELRAKAQEKGKNPEGKKAIKALLDKIGSKSISDIPEEKRAAFLCELEVL